MVRVLPNHEVPVTFPCECTPYDLRSVRPSSRLRPGRVRPMKEVSVEFPLH